MELRNFFKKKEIKDIAKKEQDFYQKNTRKKFLKIFAAASLALITCATTLLTTAPFGTSTANAAAESESAASSANLAEEIAEYKADIASGKIKYAPSALGLDPENDPVIYTTSSGLEIKSSNAITNPNLNKYLYVTMGEYNGYAINWLIVGCPPHTTENLTPAGMAIDAEISKNYYHTTQFDNMAYYDTALLAGEYRLISECTLGSCVGMAYSPYDYDESPPANSFSIVRAFPINNGTWSAFYGTYAFLNTITEYKNNNTLGLASYINNGIITTNIYAMSSAQANVLSNKIAYEIGTTTATAWWITGGHNAPLTSGTTDDVYMYYALQKSWISATGVEEVVQTGTYRRDWSSSKQKYAYGTHSTTSKQAGLRLALIAKIDQI